MTALPGFRAGSDPAQAAHATIRRLAILLLAAMAGCRADSPGGADDRPAPVEARAEERERMVRDQIEARGIADPRVLAALRAVPRHRFVPADQAARAYADHPLPIGHRQTISQPYIVAFMTEALGLQPGEKVLEIGTGSGYQAAVLAALGCRVFSIEIVEPLAARAEATLRELGYEVSVRAGDGYRGWPEAAPFDAVLVTAAPDHVPQPLVDQLRDGGRMILPVGDAVQELVLLRKEAGDVRREAVLPVRFVPMTGEAERRGR